MRPITNADSNAAWRIVRREWKREHPKAWTNDSLRAVLLALGKEDQAVRERFTAESIKDTAYTRRMFTTDSINSVRLHAIFARFGWPGKSMVGVDGAEAAFEIAQHSETIESEGLALMQSAPRGEVSATELAMLIDRTRVHSGLRQLYGSQFSSNGHGPLVLAPLDDPAHLEERRAKAGLPPLRAYACALATGMHGAVVIPVELERFLNR